MEFESKFLYEKSSTGKTKCWCIRVDNLGEYSTIVTSTGYVDGTMRDIEKNIYVGKNIGKANETTHYEQALSEAESDFKKKLRKGYVESLASVNDGSAGTKLPMLAHKWTDKQKHVKYPCFCQPKLNGVRNYTNSDHVVPTFNSRGGKVFNSLKHIKSDVEVLAKGFPNIDFDGEFFTTRLSFEEIVSAVKNEEDPPEFATLVEYHIYDLYDNIPSTFTDRFCNRIDELKKFISDNNLHSIKIVETVECWSKEDIDKLHYEEYSQDFEGTMIRNSDGLYTHRHRSNDLLKRKEFIDEEFEIVGGKSGVGTSEGQAVLECTTLEGKRFSVRCKGTDEYRRWQLDNLDSLIGKMLTVKFQNYSSEGVPIFGVGVEVRDYE